MILPPWLTVKPLLIAIGVLLVAVVGLSIAVKVYKAEAAAAVAEREAAQALVDARTGERDAFADRVDELVRANRAWSETVDAVTAELERAQAEALRIGEQSRRAVATARAEAADADRTLKRFVDQFAAESRRPACAQALAQMEAACPALRNY